MEARIYPGGELELFAEAVRWKGYIRSELRPWMGKKVLEVGAGMGGSTAALCSGREEFWIGLEPDPDLALILESRVKEGRLPPAFRALRGTLSALGEREAFDTILYIDVLEHIADDKAELADAAQRLEPGGALAVLSPAHPFLTTAFDRAIGHHRRYTKASLAAAGPQGCRLACLRYLDSVGVFLSLANRLLLQQEMPAPAQVRFWDRIVVPLSRLLDPLFGYRAGKSVLAVWRKN